MLANGGTKKEAGEEAVSMADKIRQWAPVGFVYLLWVAIFTIAQMLLNNTIEEKLISRDCSPPTPVSNRSARSSKGCRARITRSAPRSALA